MTKKQRVVITGAAGFIGSSLVERLRDNFDIVALDKNVAHRETGLISCDVLRDTQKLREYVMPNDIVIHLACTTFPAISEIDRIGDAEENIIGTLALLQICKDKGVRKVVFLSSGGTVYGNGQKPHKENDALFPQSSYGTIKVALEHYIRIYGLNGLRHVILRPSNIYGRRTISENQMLGAVDIFLHHTMNGEPIKIWGDGNNVRDYLYIEDLLNFIELSLQDQMSGTYNVGTGVGTSLNQIVQTIEEMSCKKARVEYLPARETDVRSNILDANKAKQIGWVPRYSLEKGVEDMLRRFF